MIALGIIGMLFVIAASIFEAVMDKLNFHFDKSIFVDKKNQLFWNPELSWKNKWKEDLKTEKFRGSSTIFVFTTDAWHLFKFFRNTSLFIGLPLLFFFPLNLIVSVIIARILYGLFFTYCFDSAFVKKG
jgi:hypothetical protein